MKSIMFPSKRTLIIASIIMLFAIVGVVVSVYATSRNSASNIKNSAATASAEEKAAAEDTTVTPVQNTATTPDTPIAAQPTQEASTPQTSTQPAADPALDQMCAATKKVADNYLSKTDPDGAPLYHSLQEVYDDNRIQPAMREVLKSNYTTCVTAGKI